MKNEKPIVILDLETTGTNVVTDRIVQIAAVKVLNGEVIEKKETLIDPEIPIPEGATAIHGISDEMVKGKPKFSQLAKGVSGFMKGCDIAGYNILKFDIPLLAEEMLRVGITPSFDKSDTKYIDACFIFQIKEERTLAKALEFYCGKDIEGAHDALNDVMATLDVLKGQIKMYEDIKEDFDGLDDVLWKDCKPFDLACKIGINKKGEFIFMTGKHKGKLVKDHRDYAAWIMRSDFPRDTKDKLNFILS